MPEGRSEPDAGAVAGSSAPVSLESLSGGWRRAFDAADVALDSAADHLTPDNLTERRSRLRSERLETGAVLGQLAALRGDRDPFVSLMIPRAQIKPLLGVPAD